MECLSVLLLSVTVSNLNSCSNSKLHQLLRVLRHHSTTGVSVRSRIANSYLRQCPGLQRRSSTADQDCHQIILCTKQQRSSGTG